jgi:hypothetical protein
MPEPAPGSQPAPAEPIIRPMKLLIYAMESSGASTFCYFLGQRPGSVAVIDVWSECLTPPLEIDVPVVAKATTTMTYRAVDHTASFRPDKTILFIRDPVAVYASLSEKPYANTSGSIEEKITRFDNDYAKMDVDLVLRYEDFVVRGDNVVKSINQLKWPCTDGYYDLPRSLTNIYEFNCSQSSWLKQHYNECWGFGNIKEGAISSAFTERSYPDELVEKISRLSPTLSRYYGHSP